MPYTRSMRAKTIRVKSRKAGGQRARRVGPPYGNAAAIPGLHEWAMGRRGETARSGVLPSALRHAREAASMRGGLPDLRGRPTEGTNTLSEGGTGG